MILLVVLFFKFIILKKKSMNIKLVIDTNKFVYSLIFMFIHPIFFLFEQASFFNLCKKKEEKQKKENSQKKI